VSFDLDDATAGRELKNVTISVHGDDTSRVDVENHRSDLGPHFVLALEAANVDTARDATLPSVQNPDPVDWQLSPRSFARQTPLLLGEDGCEVPIPAHEAEYAYRFTQIVRTTASSSQPTESGVDGSGVVSALAPTKIQLLKGDQPMPRLANFSKDADAACVYEQYDKLEQELIVSSDGCSPAERG
jgi:hypothetical protein